MTERLLFMVGADFPKLVTNKAHDAEDAVGHNDGFCHACAAIYTAVMKALTGIIEDCLTPQEMPNTGVSDNTDNLDPLDDPEDYRPMLL